MRLPKVFEPVVKVVSKHDNALLTLGIIGGTVSAVIFALKDGPKIVAKLDELNEQEATNLQKAKAIVPLAARTVAATGVTIGCALANNRITAKKLNDATETISTLAGLYSVSQFANEEFKKHAEEVVGEETVQKIEQGIVDSHSKKVLCPTTGTSPKIYDTGKGHDIFLDKWSGRLFYSSRAEIEQALIDINHKLMSEMWVSVNQYYDCLNLPNIKAGENIGWNVNWGKIDVKFITDSNGVYSEVEFWNEPVSRQMTGRW